MSLQLTYIPSKYWNKETSGFALLTKKVDIPRDTGFFLFWITDSITNETPQAKIEDIERNIIRNFPKIPAKKLLSCSMKIVVSSQKKKKKYFPINNILGKIMPLGPAIKLLFAININESKDRSQKIIHYEDSIKTWAYLTKFTMELLSRGNFIPNLFKINEDEYKGKWNIVFKTQRDYERINQIIQKSTLLSYNLPFDFIKAQTSKKNEENYFTSALWHPSYLFSEYMNIIADLLIKKTMGTKFIQKIASTYNYGLSDFEEACSDENDGPWDIRYLKVLVDNQSTFKINRFCDTPIPSILQNWIQNAQGFSFSLGIAFIFQLDYPKDSKSDWILNYFLQPIHNPDNLIPLADLWDGIVTSQSEYANVCNDENLLQEKVLRALGTAKRFFPPINRSLESKNPQNVKIKIFEVMDFLRTSMYLLRQAGFVVNLPEQFASKGQQCLTARMVIQPRNLEITKKNSSMGALTSQSLFNRDTMMEFHWEAQLEGKSLTDDEFIKLANSKDPLIFWRDQWILIDPYDMDQLRPIFKEKEKIKGEIPYLEAIKLGMMNEISINEGGSTFEVKIEGDFENIIEHLQSIEQFEPILVPKSFNGKLRPYQEKALTWLGNMAKLNFGICLADDMGLGKTIEIISFLLYQQAIFKKINSVLIICPTSVLFNWHRELNKFAPNLKVLIHHGPERDKGDEILTKFIKANQIILTTYGTIRNDIDNLEPLLFSGIILDESQNIKNYKTQQTQAILRLKSQYRIALSGTPIENRLIELWTLFEFLNPGLLGKKAHFQKEFILPIERFQNEFISNRLKKFISPFIMRRLKSDKNIISDLPEKNEIKIYLELAKDQAELYAKVVDSTLKELENKEIENIKRKGIILKLLTHTKQICNHPFQYLHLDKSLIEDNSEISNLNKEISNQPLPEDIHQKIKKYSVEDFLKASTKVKRLVEMFDEILEEGEKILIFTQFKQMGELLQHMLEKKYNIPILFFHGGIPQKRREVMVDEFQSADFQSPPIMILSLRAGGTGLNLTQASTVFHFDRWWNPAIEDQATDRAYRIGQKNRVNVYKFISIGTIEEKIDQMLEEKRNLADSILSSKGENWITSLTNSELNELFSLHKSW